MTNYENVAVCIPCFNEAISIAQVVADFKENLPGAKIYVFDNNSTDNTKEIAQKAGAIVYNEPKQGKGNVVRTMFANIEADFYLMVDGDNTYDAKVAPQMLELAIKKQLSMVVGARSQNKNAYRAMHIFGNKVFSALVNYFFKIKITDLFSGYRLMSRQFVKVMYIKSKNFEIETEITIHAATLNLSIEEIATEYKPRMENSVSKLSTYKDGLKILLLAFYYIHQQRPMFVFSILAFLSLFCALFTGSTVIYEFINTGIVTKIPTAILATGMGILTILFIAMGLILDSLALTRNQNMYLNFLNLGSTKEKQ